MLSLCETTELLCESENITRTSTDIVVSKKKNPKTTMSVKWSKFSILSELFL